MGIAGGEDARRTLRAFAASCWRGRLNGLLTLLRGRERAAGGSWSSVSSTIEDRVRAFVAGLIVLLACATLSGCNDVAANPPNTDAQAQFALDRKSTRLNSSHSS